MTIPEALALALRHHQAGQLQAAEQIYRQILNIDPNHVDAWHLLGVVNAQLGRHQAGVECMRRALALKPDLAGAHCNLGNALRELGKADEAVACYRRALELMPEVAGVHNNLGAALRDLGRLDEAIGCYRRALELTPDYAEAHNSLGAALHDQGELDQAVACYRRALDLRADYAEAHNNLGNALQNQGKLDEALGCYHRAVELKPHFAEAHNNLGNTFRDQGNLDEAVGCYRRALELKPDFAGAHNNLGNAFRDLGMLDEAVGCYRRALELKPELAGTHNNLGNTLRSQGKLDEAVACYSRILELKPDYAEAHNSLGAALHDQGKLDQSAACYRRALDLRPDYAQAYSNLGITLQQQGRLDEAVACFRQVLQIEMGSFLSDRKDQQGASGSSSRAEALDTLGEAFGQLAIILRSRLPDDDLLAIKQLLTQSILRDDGRAALGFALAQTLDARRDYSAAADHLDAANAARFAVLKKRDRQYRPERQRVFTSGMIATFTPEFFARVNGFGLETEQPVFIFGLPRSGTTLVEQILASHPRVFGAGELRYCQETVQALSGVMNHGDTPFEYLLDQGRETARHFAQQHLDRLRALDQRADRIVDKMPENFQHLGLINVLFPGARLIHCRRDFRDVALSCRLTNFASLSWPCNTEHLVSYFEEYARLMDHWRKVLPSPPLDVHYEEMVEDTEPVARRVVDWCGLDWDPACLRFYETERTVQTASVAQVRRPIYKTSIGRWKSYEKLLSELFSRVDEIEQTWLRGQQPGGSS
jgi:tetratricopeptide (TPR) repeat protein